MARPLGPEDPVIALSKRDDISIRALNQALAITGMPGGGKTSTSFKAAFTGCIRCGMGGLVTTVKPGDTAKVVQWVKEAGRERSLVVIGPQSTYLFNFLQYVMATSPRPEDLLLNLVAFLSHIVETMSGRVSAAGGDQAFWQKATQELLFNSLTLLWAAYGRVNLYDLFALVHSRPNSHQEAVSQRWLGESYCAHVLERAKHGGIAPLNSMDYRVVNDYVTRVLANPDPRTTGNLIATISADLAPLLQGGLRDMFCTGLNITPEHAIEGGAIIVLDYPVEKYGRVGLLAQQIFRYAFQKAVLRREMTSRSPNTFIAIDEYSTFVSPYDAEFLSLSRESRCATILSFQNIPGLFSRIGGQNPRDTAEQILGNIGNFIFHANGDFRTNEWAANAIGKSLQHLYNTNAGVNMSDGISHQSGQGFQKSGQAGTRGTHSENSSTTRSFNYGRSLNRGVSEVMDFEVQPGVFTRMRTGGRPNRYLVDAIVFRPGNVFKHSGKAWMPVVFSQR